MTHSPEGLRSLLERHELALARLRRALEACDNGAVELGSFNAEWDAETGRLSADERRAVAEFLSALIALDADERDS